MDWAWIQAHLDWLGHVVEAFAIAAVVFVLCRINCDARTSWLMGLAFAVGHFHGREKRDYEVSVAMPPPHLDGYLMWRWSLDQMTDFWPVAIVCGLAAILIARGGRAGR